MGKEIKIAIVAPWPASDDLSDALRLLTQAIDFVGAADGAAGGLFGGTWGYGADYENDVFMMHRYCWCESMDCPWCGGCSIDHERESHAPDCYQSRLEALKKKYGSRMRGSDHYHVEFGHKRYGAEAEALCREMGLTYPAASEVHCTCGAVQRWQAAYRACQCDWHLGKAQYRFGPAQSAPHFWHKPTGAQVRWYKYIGRGMETTLPDGFHWPDVFAQCHESLRAADAVDPVSRGAHD